MRQNNSHRSPTVPVAAISNARYSSTKVRVIKIPRRHQSLVNEVQFFKIFLKIIFTVIYTNLLSSLIVYQRRPDDLKVSFIEPFDRQATVSR